MSDYEDYFVDDDYRECYDPWELKRVNIDNNRRRYLCRHCGAVLSQRRHHYPGKNRTRVRINLAYPSYVDEILAMYPDAEITAATGEQIQSDKERRRTEIRKSVPQ